MNAQPLSTIQRVALIVSTISLLAWGIPFILFPDFVWTVIGGVAESVSPVYTRYSGAWFVGPAVGCIMVMRNPAMIGTLFDILTIAGCLSFIVLLFDYFAGNSVAADWFIWMAIVDSAVITVLCYLSRPKSTPAG